MESAEYNVLAFLKKYVLVLGGFLLVSACTPVVIHPGKPVQQAILMDDFFVTQDGIKLGLHIWLPKTETIEAVIIALHGFNDYGNFFNEPALYFSDSGIASYAYDQRGFGGSPDPGLWSGVDAYANDLASFTRLVKERHPDIPIFLLGASMGGAVVLVTESGNNSPLVTGVILVAPAVWGRETMPWYQKLLLTVMSHSLPWMTLTGEGLEIKPSDNIEMLRALGRDSLVIKETRVDTIYGLVNLMDAALNRSRGFRAKTLLLYGELDEIIPKQPTLKMIEELSAPPIQLHRVSLYSNGYHMLLRDLQAETVWRDIVAWIHDPDGSLPSGSDIYGKEWIHTFRE